MRAGRFLCREEQNMRSFRFRPELRIPCRWCIPRVSEHHICDMNDMKLTSLQSLFDVLRPPEGRDRLSAYLKAVAKALGGKTDVALAGALGVEASSVANWKRRGSVPREYIAWFTTALVEKIGTYSSELRPVTLEARSSVLALLANTSGNPLQVKGRIEEATALALPALFCLAQFLLEALIAHGESPDSITIERVSDLLEASMLTLRHADQLRHFQHS